MVELHRVGQVERGPLPGAGVAHHVEHDRLHLVADVAYRLGVLLGPHRRVGVEEVPRAAVRDGLGGEIRLESRVVGEYLPQAVRV